MTNLTNSTTNLSLAVAVEREWRRRRAPRASGGGVGWHALVSIRTPGPQQDAFLTSKTKRKVIRAGRRGGKTVGVSILALRALLANRRVLYATPTQEQVDRFWTECKLACAEAIDAGHLIKNETRHLIEVPRSEARIRAKTAWDADTLRGDYADLLILDEFQLMHEDTWALVGAPMLLDNDGDAVFIYTPPSRRSLERSRARDPRHAAKLYKRADQDTTGRWEVFHFASHANPFISEAALGEITGDMTDLAYRQEILANDEDDVPGALWKRATIDALRWSGPLPELTRIGTALDPSNTSTGDEAGVVTAGVGMCRCKGAPELHGFVLADDSLQGSPDQWAGAGVSAYHRHQADVLVAEDNNGGEMIEVVIGTIHGAPQVKRIHASRGKQTRAEPVSILYDQGKVHHVGVFGALEEEMVTWTPGMPSPNRMDALVWALTEVQLNAATTGFVHRYDTRYRPQGRR